MFFMCHITIDLSAFAKNSYKNTPTSRESRHANRVWSFLLFYAQMLALKIHIFRTIQTKNDYLLATVFVLAVRSFEGLEPLKAKRALPSVAFNS